MSKVLFIFYLFNWIAFNKCFLSLCFMIYNIASNL